MTLLLSAIFVFFAGLATGLAIMSLVWNFKHIAKIVNDAEWNTNRINQLLFDYQELRRMQEIMEMENYINGKDSPDTPNTRQF